MFSATIFNYFISFKKTIKKLIFTTLISIYIPILTVISISLILSYHFKIPKNLKREEDRIFLFIIKAFYIFLKDRAVFIILKY